MAPLNFRSIAGPVLVAVALGLVPARLCATPAFSTYVNPATDLAPASIVVTESTEPDGRVRLTVACGINNTDSGTWEEVNVAFVSPAGITAEVADPMITIGSIAPSAAIAAPAGDTIQVIVAAGDASTVHASLQNGSSLKPSGYEKWILTGPGKAVDQATEDLFTGPVDIVPPVTGRIRLTFSATTAFLQSLQSGDIMLEDPGVNSLGLPPAGDPQEALFIVTHLPFQVSAVTFNSDGTVWVDGEKKDVLQVLRSGTFIADARFAYDGANGTTIDPTNPWIENNFTAAETADREDEAAIIAAEDPRDIRLNDLRGFHATPFRFNNVKISNFLTLSGELFVRASVLKVEVVIRDFEVKRVVFHPTLTARLTGKIDVLEGTDNTNEPLLDKEHTIATIPLPPVPVNIAGLSFTINPFLVAKVGVTADVPTGLTIPLETSITAGMRMGWEKDTGFFYEPEHDYDPLAVSDPTVFDAIQANAGAWAELELQMLIDGLIGPTLAVRTSVDFTLSPLADPWWKLEGGLSLIGRVAFNLFGLGAARADLGEHEFASLPWLIKQANGPLIPLSAPGAGARTMASGANATPQAAGPVHYSGERLRWASGFQKASQNSGGYDNGFVIALPDDSVIAGGASSLSNFLVKYSSTGEMLWSKTPPIGISWPDGAANADGTFVMAGLNFSGLWVGKFSADGVMLWGRGFKGDASFDPDNVLLASPSVRHIAADVDETTGRSVYYVLGSVAWNVVTEADPWLMKIDDDGNVVWMNVYKRSGGDTTLGLLVARNGDIIISGETTADVADPDQGTPGGNNILINASGNGLLMRVGSDGSLLWSKAYASRWGMPIHDIVEAPDGRLYFTGGVAWPVNVDLPSIAVGYCNADGTGFTHCLVNELGEAPFPDDLAVAGNTSYDVGARILWSPNGPVVVGTTGLGTATAGLCIGLTDELGARFFTAFDGASSDSLNDAALMSDGLVVMGSTQSLFPLGSSGQWSTMIAKLPWEGSMRFTESTGVTVYSLQPRVYRSSGTSNFVTTSTSGQLSFANDTSTAEFVATPVTPVADVVPGGPVAASLIAFHMERQDAAPLSIIDQPDAAELRTGAPLSLSVGVTGGTPITYQWFKDNSAIAGATGATYAVPVTDGSEAGTYRVQVSNPHGTVDSADAIVVFASDAARLVNISARALVGTNDSVLIPGFVVSGGPLRLLVRAVGPGLTPYNVTGVLDDPTLSVFNQQGVVLQSNDNWDQAANATEVSMASTQVGAFALGAGSRDAALLVTLQPGLYTAVVSGAGGTTGVGLVELYEVDGGGSGGRLANMSVRAQVGSGSEVLIPGIVLGGSTARTLLIRAVGPTLADLHVSGVLPDPEITLFSGSSIIDSNDNWSSSPHAAEIVAANAQVGAFALPDGSGDAALLITLAPGAYTAHVRGVGDQGGVCLVEVYEIP